MIGIDEPIPVPPRKPGESRAQYRIRRDFLLGPQPRFPWRTLFKLLFYVLATLFILGTGLTIFAVGFKLAILAIVVKVMTSIRPQRR